MAYGGWVVFLGRDFSNSLARLASLRLAAFSLGGACLGAVLFLLCWTILSLLRGIGRRLFIGGAVALAGAGVVFMGLAALPFRQTFFGLHQFSPLPLVLALVALQGALLLGIVAWSALQVARPIAPGRGAGVALAGTGWGLALTSALVLIATGMMPLEAGVSGRPIIIVSFDTMRADRLGALGYPRPTTPHLDALAAQGALFEQAGSTAPWTLPSHASMFTSLLPFDHGSTRETRPLRPSLSTLAERLKNAGYRTAAFTGGAYVSAGFGFGQGFEVYDDHDEGKEGGAGKIAQSALAWIRSVKDKPFFAFVHSYEIHFPYRHQQFVPASVRATGKTPYDIDDLTEIHSGKKVLSEEDRTFVADLYDGDVATADEVLGGMLSTLRKEGILDRAILVVLSDHGDDLWNHDDYWSPGHGHSLYEEILHVVLFFRAPGLVKEGARLKTPVSLLDVLPTLLDLVGIAPQPQDQGRSLKATLQEGTEPEAAPMSAEAIEYGPDRFSIRQGRFKAIMVPKPDETRCGILLHLKPLEVFDLSADPQEKHDLSAAPPAETAALIERLWKRVERVQGTGAPGHGGESIPKELEEQLRSLGYVR